MQNMKTIVLVILAIVAVVLMIQNTEQVETKILFITIAMPRALLLLVTLLIGVVIGILVGRKAAPKKDEAKS